VPTSPPTPNSFVDRIVADFGEDLLRFLSRRVHTAADARDLAQEAYVRLLRLDRKDLIREPQPYLFRVAANLLHELELKRRADAEGLRRWTEEHRLDSTGPSLERELEARTTGEQVARVLAELTPKCRAVVVLHRRDGMTYDEIAERIGISSSMVKKYLGIGLRHCRKRLRDAR
jgi:RNA polymerase sigma factor (sigma-70 family)